MTEKAILHTWTRFDNEGIQHNVQVADAENLCFDDNTFNIVYSYGVLHHSPNFDAAVSEVHRVLRPGGIAKIMIYHRYSIVGMMLWFRYGFLRGRPFLGLGYIYDMYLESPGTKAFSVSEAKEMFKNFSNLSITTKLSFGDLLQREVG